MTPLEKAKLSLLGVATGDAFGQRMFGIGMEVFHMAKTIPGGDWYWTDDTAMAISIYEILRDYNEINQDVLANTFAERYRKDVFRGYGTGAHLMLQKISEGEDWRELAPSLFNGNGSYGNGAAMRIAPLGAYFYKDLELVRAEAVKSAEITHSHPEGQAGAVALAVAAALAASGKNWERIDFIKQVEDLTPDSDVRAKITISKSIDADNLELAVDVLGTGMDISAQDTVPFCVWCAANNLHDFEAAMWQTVSGFGDQDTTCAMVGGIVALSVGSIPEKFLEHVEPLPEL
ncbi:MAG: ADP-ribosylglycohydrolase family protein [Calditrichae bacterium]|nr:ADP-ribosylglycohydrolase family protein [Calditrichota bacterium]MCB9057147.1 ADP-ribosylglycohydrolase family protein [Calditrichia bacterium]